MLLHQEVKAWTLESGPFVNPGFATLKRWGILDAYFKFLELLPIRTAVKSIWDTEGKSLAHNRPLPCGKHHSRALIWEPAQKGIHTSGLQRSL